MATRRGETGGLDIIKDPSLFKNQIYLLYITHNKCAEIRNMGVRRVVSLAGTAPDPAPP